MQVNYGAFFEKIQATASANEISDQPDETGGSGKSSGGRKEFFVEPGFPAWPKHPLVAEGTFSRTER